METTIVPDQNLASQFALRVALQTMKERCISLQKRLTTIEEENQTLRKQLETEPHVVLTSSGGSVVENFQLRTQVAELNRQKTQINEHINMVSTENRKLWSRLSQIAKEHNETSTTACDARLATNAAKDNDCMLTDQVTTQINIRADGSSNQNLIRSKTFTQHSPNPNLRHKLIASDNAGGDMNDISLEEVALGPYQQKASGAGEDYAEVATEAELGFAYLNVDGVGGDNELNAEAKHCSEGLEEIRREAIKQQEELHAALTILESKIVLTHCRECEKNSKKPEMADKSLETDDSINELKLYNTQPSNIYTQQPSFTQNVNLNGDSSSVTETRLNIIQDKIQADTEKTCPMCGKSFNSVVTFNAFREHVETHFIDDSSDVEASIERNSEFFISHALGDF